MNGKNIKTISFKKCLPLLLMEAIIGVSYFLYRNGPWIYPGQKNIKPLLFVVLVMVLFATGYLVQLFKRKDVKNQLETNEINKYARILLIINVFLLIPYCYGKTGSFFPRIITALSNLSVAYTASSIATSAGGITHIIAALSNVFIYPLFLMLFFYFERISSKTRILMMIEVIWYYLTEMCTGHNRNVFFYSILIFVCCVLVLCSNFDISKKIKLKKFVIAVLAMLLACCYFAIALESRNENTKAELEASGKSISEIIKESDAYSKMMLEEYGYNENGKWATDEEINNYYKNKDAAIKINPYYATDFIYSYVDTNHWIYRITPSALRYYVSIFIFYVSHGYNAINIGLDIPFETSFGLGTFSFFQKIAKRITGVDFYKQTYVYKINQHGYPISLYWGTAYTQWASDISWVGVIILMGIIGFVVSKLWISIIYDGDIFSMFFFCHLMFYLVMILSWWHPGMSCGDFVSFHVLLLAWIIHIFINYRKSKSGKLC